MTKKPFLVRTEAAEFLTNSGYPVAVRTLSKLACIGGGPKFRKFGNKRPLYSPDDLLAWARSRTSEPVATTSEFSARAAQ